MGSPLRRWPVYPGRVAPHALEVDSVIGTRPIVADDVTLQHRAALLQRARTTLTPTEGSLDFVGPTPT